MRILVHHTHFFGAYCMTYGIQSNTHAHTHTQTHTHTHAHSYIYIYILTYIHTGLEIGGIATPNENHFWDNCESLWLSDSPNFWHCESLLADCESLFKWIRQKTVYGPHYIFRRNFPSFRQIFCIKCKNVNKLRIMIRNCE